MENSLPLSKESLKLLSEISLAAGFISIAASIITWFSKSGDDPAHAERFGIFIGLWVPSFFALSHRLSRMAAEDK